MTRTRRPAPPWLGFKRYWQRYETTPRLRPAGPLAEHLHGDGRYLSRCAGHGVVTISMESVPVPLECFHAAVLVRHDLERFLRSEPGPHRTAKPSPRQWSCVVARRRAAGFRLHEIGRASC